MCNDFFTTCTWGHIQVLKPCHFLHNGSILILLFLLYGFRISKILNLKIFKEIKIKSIQYTGILLHFFGHFYFWPLCYDVFVSNFSKFLPNFPRLWPFFPIFWGLLPIFFAHFDYSYPYLPIFDPVYVIIFGQ